MKQSTTITAKHYINKFGKRHTAYQHIYICFKIKYRYHSIDQQLTCTEVKPIVNYSQKCKESITSI